MPFDAADTMPLPLAPMPEFSLPGFRCPRCRFTAFRYYFDASCQMTPLSSFERFHFGFTADFAAYAHAVATCSLDFRPAVRDR